jgi:hypothetical protein
MSTVRMTPAEKHALLGWNHMILNGCRDVNIEPTPKIFV